MSAPVSAASATTASGTTYLTAVRTCGIPAKGSASCFAMRLVRSKTKTAGAVAEPAAVKAAATLPNGPAGGYTPGDLATAYDFNANASFATPTTVAIVDAYDNPFIKADLAAFDTEYGLPAETANSFRVVNETGQTSPLPTYNAGWAGEEDLDVQTVRGLCHKCKILLVEASSNGDADLQKAENRAVIMHASVVSNSYGEQESGPVSSAEKRAYDHPGVAIVASTGDDGWYSWDNVNAGKRGLDAPNLPSTLQTVIAVGGTTLTLNPNGTRAGETVWNENGPFDYFGNQLSESMGATGGGCSTVITAPAWQQAIPGYNRMGCGEKRLAADVSALADPFTGYDIFLGSAGKWETYGGTSLSSPIISAMIALAGGANGVDYPGQTIYDNYVAQPSNNPSIYDVTIGANGACDTATAGSCVSYFGESPNLFLGTSADCNFSTTTTSTVPVANAGQCDAGPGYDGPSGVGAPTGLNLFKP